MIGYAPSTAGFSALLCRRIGGMFRREGSRRAVARLINAEEIEMNVRELIDKLKYFSDDTRVVYISHQDQRHDIDIVRAEHEHVWDYETRYPRQFDMGKTIAVLE